VRIHGGMEDEPVAAPHGPMLRSKSLGERGHGPVVHLNPQHDGT